MKYLLRLIILSIGGREIPFHAGSRNPAVAAILHASRQCSHLIDPGGGLSIEEVLMANVEAVSIGSIFKEDGELIAEKGNP